jgi:hypothetical protein
MMLTMTGERTPVSRAQLAWLDEQASRWLADHLIDAPTRDRILDRYDAEGFEGRSQSALTILAVLICAIGVLLLIGYNWSRIPPPAKIAAILGAVAEAFGGAAAAYSANRPRLGETLAFAGTMLYGNAIWLIAQVLHISGRFPDGFLWFGLGALAAAWLVRSRWIGTAAAALVICWLVAEGLDQGDPPLAFLAVWPAAVAAAYGLRSPVMAGVAAIAIVPWVVVAGDGLDSILGTGAVLLTGCALEAVACWHPDRSPLARPWQVSGRLVQLVILVPLMIHGAQREILDDAAWGSPLAVTVAAVLALAAMSGVFRARTISDTVAGLAAAMTSAWIVLGAQRAITPLASTLLFSAIALAIGVALIRTALRTGKLGDLVFGVLFTMAFLIVRWVSLVDNMLLSGLLLLLTGSGLLVLARLWRGRDRAAESAS